MSLEVVNPRESNDDSNPDTMTKVANFVATAMSIGGAIHVGMHFNSVLHGILMFIFLEVLQAVSVVCSMSKDEFLTFSAKKLESDENGKNFVKSLYYKYLPQSCIGIALGYFGVRLYCGF